MPDPPNFEERLGAVAQTLVIVAGMQLANEKAIATLTERTIQAMEAIGRLANIAAIHERLDRLEDNQ